MRPPGAFQQRSGGRKAAAVARAVPCALMAVPLNNALQVRAERRHGVQAPALVAVDRSALSIHVQQCAATTGQLTGRARGRRGKPISTMCRATVALVRAQPEAERTG